MTSSFDGRAEGIFDGRGLVQTVMLVELPLLAPPTIAVLTAASLTSYAPRVVFDATVVYRCIV